MALMTPMAEELQCWNCAASLAEVPRPISRHMNCPKCFEDLHCCRMCRHYIDNATNPCDDERADPPVHKEGANFCDFFRPSNASYRSGANERRERRERAKTRLDALFGSPDDAGAGGQGDASPAEGKPSDPAPETSKARRELDDLFR